MSKQKFKITNWSAYNNALRQRGSLMVWLDESAIAAWTDSTQPEGRGRPLHYTDMAITTVLMMKRVFNLPLRALQGFVDSIFKLMELPLCCPDYSLVSKRAKSVNISIKTPTRGEISHLVIDSTGLKVFGEGEWKVRLHGTDKRRVWRKLHLAADSVTHEIICADLSLSGTTDSQAMPGLINQTHRKIKEVSADGAICVMWREMPLTNNGLSGLAPIFPYTFYHLTHYWFAAADIPVVNDIPVHYADAIRCNVRRPPQGSLPLLTRQVSA